MHTHPLGIRWTDSITFTFNDAIGVHFLHNDDLVVRAVVSRNCLERMLEDDGSSVNIIYGTTYDKMGINSPFIPTTDLIYSLTRDSIICREIVILVTEMVEVPTTMWSPTISLADRL
ncbi:Uncharacterized protein Adt_11161 [Abeliophyllum distichum]|uniref:Uncharacterized protein n=1 Tax=Abeliophyllum distichum TaxID=126358 RepID=A0ABD1UM16_9LAMI